MTEVKSSQIAAIGHDPATNALTARFKNGGTYEYAGVPAALHAELMASKSVGLAFADKIKKGGFAYHKVTE